MQVFVEDIEFLAKVNDISRRFNLVLNLTGEFIMQMPVERVNLLVVPRDTRSKLVENLFDISREFAFLAELFTEIVNLALLISDEGSEFSSLEGYYLFMATSLIFDGIDILLDKLHRGTEIRDFEVGSLLESRKRGRENIDNI